MQQHHDRKQLYRKKKRKHAIIGIVTFNDYTKKKGAILEYNNLRRSHPSINVKGQKSLYLNSGTHCPNKITTAL
jgi:hypothetical protein